MGLLSRKLRSMPLEPPAPNLMYLADFQGMRSPRHLEEMNRIVDLALDYTREHSDELVPWSTALVEMFTPAQEGTLGGDLLAKTSADDMATVRQAAALGVALSKIEISTGWAKPSKVDGRIVFTIAMRPVFDEHSKSLPVQYFMRLGHYIGRAGPNGTNDALEIARQSSRRARLPPPSAAPQPPPPRPADTDLPPPIWASTSDGSSEWEPGRHPSPLDRDSLARIAALERNESPTVLDHGTVKSKEVDKQLYEDYEARVGPGSVRKLAKATGTGLNVMESDWVASEAGLYYVNPVLGIPKSWKWEDIKSLDVKHAGPMVKTLQVVDSSGSTELSMARTAADSLLKIYEAMKPPPSPQESEPSWAEGWYPDPMGRYEHRFWDGEQWTVHVATGGTQSIDPI